MSFQILHRLFFNTLLTARHYDKFFIFAAQLADSLTGYHFGYQLQQMMDDVGFPKLKRYLKPGIQRLTRQYILKIIH